MLGGTPVPAVRAQGAPAAEVAIATLGDALRAPPWHLVCELRVWRRASQYPGHLAPVL